MVLPRAYLNLMKTPYSLAVVAVAALALAGCANNTATTAQTETDQTTKRVHTQEEMRKSGESETGPALEKTDASIRIDGNR
jgi:type IV pilus biogenesis protein CpaD/CtpE